MATNTHHPQDNWAHFRRLVEQQIELTTAQLELWQSILEEGDHADHLDFVQQLQFDSTATTLTVVPEAEPRRRMVEAPEMNKPWTATEEELVVAGRLLGLSNKQIGDKIGRSERSVESRCTSLRAQGRI